MALSSLLQLRARLRASLPELHEASSPAPQIHDPTETSSDAKALLDFIGGEIIPRLMVAHQINTDPALSDDIQLGPDIHRRFLDLILEGTERATSQFVDDLVDRGVPLETIYLELLANAARRLGELWETDARSFTDVTIGLLRLHRILRERRLQEDDRVPSHVGGHRSRVLMVSACGDQHVFGLLMVSEFFRKAGWWVFSEPGARPEQVEEMLSTDVFDLLGVSASCTTIAAQVQGEIARYRTASCNQDLKVLVGGRLFTESPDLCSQVGADAVADDPHEALRIADALVGQVALGP